MPKRMISSGETSTFNTGAVTVEKTGRSYGRAGRVAGALALAGGLILANETAANADVIFVPGACDGAGHGLTGTLLQQGRLGSQDRVVQYPAGMGMHCGPTPANESIAIAGQQVVDFYYQNQHDPYPVVAEGFSLGAGGVDWAAMRLREQHGGNLPPNFIPVSVGDGWSDPGVLNHPIAPIAGVIAGPILGLPNTHELHPVPGQVVRLDADDFFGATGAAGWDIARQIQIWAGSANGAHRVPHPGEPNIVVERDGIRYEIYGANRERAAHDIRMMPSKDPAQAVAKVATEAIESVADNPARYNPNRNTPRVSVEQYTPPVAPVALPKPEAIVIPPAPVPGQPLTPEQTAFLDQFSSAVGGIK